MTLSYFENIGLDVIEDESFEELVSYLEELVAPKIGADIQNPFVYHVPELSEDGACSIHGKLSDVPYDLAPILCGEDLEKRALWERRLRMLYLVVEYIAEISEVDRLGVYMRVMNTQGEDVLVKLAYVGAPSRAEFPLTEEFAKGSNNSQVGLTGKSVCIDTVADHEGAYYVCDTKVQSELCVPVLDLDGKLLGIIDAESFASHHFDKEKKTIIGTFSYWLGILYGDLRY